MGAGTSLPGAAKPSRTCGVRTRCWGLGVGRAQPQPRPEQDALAAARTQGGFGLEVAGGETKIWEVKNSLFPLCFPECDFFKFYFLFACELVRNKRRGCCLGLLVRSVCVLIWSALHRERFQKCINLLPSGVTEPSRLVFSSSLSF